MKITISTKVGKDFKTVYRGFNEALFVELKPPLLPLKLLRFDGSKTGDEVHIQLGIGVLSTRWDALIVEDKESDTACYFVDEGIQLPPFLKKWRHRHLIEKAADGSIIVDMIEYKSPNVLLDYLLYPVMYLQFYMRKPVYKRVFKRQN